jgi:hypothetical protein
MQDEVKRRRHAVLVPLVFAVASGGPPAAFACPVERETAAAHDDPRPRLALAWTDPGRAHAGLERHMKREVGALFDSMGVRVDWIAHERTPRDGRVVTVLILNHVPTSMSSDTVWGRDDYGVVLGMTERTPSPRPVIWVLLPNVKRALGLEPARGPTDPAWAQDDLARLVARVVAHEVIHALAPATPHARAGLMRARWGADLLWGRACPVDEVSATALRKALAAPLGSERPPP